MWKSRQRGAGLVDQLQSSHRFTVTVLLSVLLLSLLTSGYLIMVSQPRLATYVELSREARDAHEAMLDQETGLRGWLATGDPVFLGPYRSGKAAADTAFEGLLDDAQSMPDLTDPVVGMLLARQKWQQWADGAVTVPLTTRQRVDGTLSRLLLQGKSLFDTYRKAGTRSTDVIRTRRNTALSEQRATLVGVLGGYLVLLGAAAVASYRRRARLRTTILTPVDELLETITELRSGNLSARAARTTVPELNEIGSALAGLAAEVELAGTQAAAREQRLATLAHRFETVVRVGREIAGSLSVRYVSASVTSAAAELLGSRAVLWVRSESGEFRATHRSDDPHGVTPPDSLRACDLVIEAASDAQPTVAAGSRAYPLVLAGMVIAVLEVATTEVDPDTEQVLSALLSTAAASLESAHLHSKARELADQDGLTQLPNRRRFEQDVDAEWERCRRYGRPLSLVMMDLDHFKRLNDEHGHLLGDEVLRAVASAITASLRETDTAYRYGGEEIVVLLRETGLEDAADVAERLREAVAGVTLTGQPQLSVSTSAGVAARGAGMAHYTELVAEADRALYEAKRLGRNRVALPGETAPLPTGGALSAGGSTLAAVAAPTP